MRLLFTGGGTFGSVTPLLAIRETCPSAASFWIGTHDGPERSFVEAQGIPFIGIHSGKLRRYWSAHNLLSPLLVLWGFFDALRALRRVRPDVVVSAGGFVGVPVVVAAWLLRIPSLLLQQDVRPGLANRLAAPFARIVCCVFPETAAVFGAKAVVTGNAVRAGITHPAAHSTGPLLLVIGGGTGAVGLNELFWTIAPDVVQFIPCVHITGKGKNRVVTLSNYRAIEFATDELPALLARATLVVTRAGMGVVSELAALRKAAILVPIPESHQEDNATLIEHAGACVVIEESPDAAQTLLTTIRELIADPDRSRRMGDRLSDRIPTNGAATITAHIQKLVTNGNTSH